MTVTMTRSVAINSQDRPLRVLILGGSYGGLAAATNLADLCTGKPPRFGWDNVRPGYKVPVEITIVDERDGYYHLIGSPLALADEEYAAKAWVRFDDIKALQHHQFCIKHGSVSHVDAEEKVARITLHGGLGTEDLAYDYLVAATGLRRAWPSVPQALTRQIYLDEVRPHIERMSKAEHGVAVIGGGAVGIEMAAELKVVCPHVKVILVHSRDKLLSSEPLPDDMKDQTRALLHEAGVETIMGKRVQSTSEDTAGKLTLRLSDNSELTVSEVLDAVSGPKPTTSYLSSEALNADGEVSVNRNLTFASVATNSAYHFAIGDLIPQKGVKRCGGAMHHGHYAAYNIHQHILADRGIIEQPEYRELPDHGVHIGIAVGKQAIGYSEEAGIMAGEETMKYLFGDDLGFRYCWDYLKLSEDTKYGDGSMAESLSEPEKVAEVMGDGRVAVSAEA